MSTELKEINDRASAVGTVLLDATNEWVEEESISRLTGETGYAVRWYIFQLREAGYVIEAVKSADPFAFSCGSRGWRLVDIQDEPYRPGGEGPPPVRPKVIETGSVVEHSRWGRGRVTFAGQSAPKVVVRFKRNRIERVFRNELTLVA